MEEATLRSPLASLSILVGRTRSRGGGSFTISKKGQYQKVAREGKGEASFLRSFKWVRKGDSLSEIHVQARYKLLDPPR